MAKEDDLFQPDVRRINALLLKVGERCKDFKKIKAESKLAHDEWLVYMRSIWRFNHMTSYVKTGVHPAQFSAEIPRRLIKLYTFKNELVLDPFVGVGTTAIEAMKLERFSIGVDINVKFLNVARERVQEFLNENLEAEKFKEYLPLFICGDARDLSFLPDECVHLVIAHPPYWNVVKTSSLSRDLSNIDDYNAFLKEMEKVFEEAYRVLRPDRVLAVFTGDVLRRVNNVTQLYPLHSDYIQIARKVGFRLWDIFIVETKIRMSGGKPMMGSYPYPHKLFSEFAHNYLLIFRKNG
ncbi:hypothetical protein DRN63_02505 [Nanoarchaeota archaeon]|nr:MAG: hypothetical protein DRN63_02505 [Nanoarchaeota archaeon]